MTKRILLIDDSKTQLGSMKMLLIKAGYEVVTAVDGAEGIVKAAQFEPDIIVSDIVMPHINGYQLCRLLKDDEKTKDIPIILLTVLDKKLDKFWGMRAGADAFLLKDMGFNNLIEQINKIVAKMPEKENSLKPPIRDVEVDFDINYQVRVNNLLDNALIESTIMNEFRNLSEFVLDSNTLNKGVFSLMSSILDYDVAGFFFNDRDDRKVKELNLSINEIDFEESLLQNLKADFYSSIFDKDYWDYEKFFSLKVVQIGDEKIEKVEDLSQFKSKVIIPIVYAQKVLGGICLYHRQENKFNKSRIFQIILDELKVLMRIKWLYSETKFLAITDGLTGLYNRRYFQKTIDIEFSRAKRYGCDLSLAMFDIDNFKLLNDTYGHQFGDKVLIEVSQIIREFLRKTDYVARYGGEEIAVVLPETSLEQSIIPIERLRKQISEHDFMFAGKSIQVTVSVGIAEVDDTLVTDRDLIERADKALYKAKNAGKNRVEQFSY